MESINQEDLAYTISKYHDWPVHVERAQVTILRKHKFDKFRRREFEAQSCLNDVVACYFLIYLNSLIYEATLVHNELVGVVTEQQQSRRLQRSRIFMILNLAVP